MELLSEQSRTRRTIRDLVAFSALPGVWVNYKPLQVAEGLADALLGTLLIDFVYLRLSRRVCGQERVVARTGSQSNSEDHARQIDDALARLLETPDFHPVRSIPNPIGSGVARIVMAPVGFPVANGVVVVGSTQTDFPCEDDRLLLMAGVNHAAMVLQRIVAEQERERVLEQLRQSERRLSEAQQVAHIGSWERDLRTNQVTWSKGLYKIFGLKEDEIDLSYQKFLKLLAPQDVDRIHALVEEAIRERRHFSCDYRITLGDGRSRVLHDRGGAILDEEGAPIRLVGTVQDITEFREAEQTLREYTARLQTLSRRLLEVQEEERRHLARELHDEVGQMLTGLRLILKPTADLTPNAKAEFEKARALVDELIEAVRELSFDLRPTALDPLGLVPALITLFERYSDQTEIAVNFKHHEAEGRLPPEVEITAYRIVQEALTNVARHAHVDQVAVRVWATGDRLSVQIDDRGRGFNLDAALSCPQTGGLTGMQERVKLVDGQLTIESRPGQGTQIIAELPCGLPVKAPRHGHLHSSGR
jgi:PAS domain S-box-containing protein